ncbi:ethylene-insensitive protein 2-like [Dorcoceras hygrometricum]|uniref:Ethylene-insensitive protein 2-like n=1 Tax=Dorcoceras hygrometricum TaxID=472368 RepID=A0A2Z7DDG7_9LAMI|nr:ethylene-insensitive protein 2-like [Dorcoceras hygrometricum]
MQEGDGQHTAAMRNQCTCRARTCARGRGRHPPAAMRNQCTLAYVDIAGDRSVLLGLDCSSCVCCCSRALLLLCFLTKMRGRVAIPHSHLPAGLLALMRRVVNYHSSWVGQQQVELLMHLVFRCGVNGFSRIAVGRGYDPAGGAPGGG